MLIWLLLLSIRPILFFSPGKTFTKGIFELFIDNEFFLKLDAFDFFLFFLGFVPGLISSLILLLSILLFVLLFFGFFSNLLYISSFILFSKLLFSLVQNIINAIIKIPKIIVNIIKPELVINLLGELNSLRSDFSVLNIKNNNNQFYYNNQENDINQINI